ncbi:MAG: hypothetical protein ACLFUL_14615 [Desulfobacteraceae bacterium]
MEVRTQDGKIHPARLTTDNERHQWEFRVLNPDGTTALSAFTRAEIELAGIQIVHTSTLEWESLAKAGFQPPFTKD